MRNVPTRVAVLTLGCRVNQSESSVIEGTLRENGISIVPLSESPEFCVINTCTVTGRSDANSRQLIRKAAKTGAAVIVTGCYSQLKRDEASSLDGVFAVVPMEQKELIASLILGCNADPVFHLHDRSRPYLKVQDGCNCSCSYCAVPLARGRSRSLHPEIALQRAQEIEAQGFHEIVLTGIHLGGYGQDLAENSSLAKLIKKLLTQTGIERIRLSSIEINEIDDELLEVLGNARICRHLHLPLQSGSDRILRLMNRNYSSDSYRRKITDIFDTFSDFSVGTDLIVGFPGETTEDFKTTYRLIEELPLSYLHVFPYSRRSGTAASLMKSSVPDEVISERAESLKRLNKSKKERYAETQAGKILDIIIEEKVGPGLMVGTSSNYLKIRIETDSIRRGTMVYIRSAGFNGNEIRGVVVA